MSQKRRPTYSERKRARESARRPGKSKQVPALYVFLSADQGGDEGIIAHMTPLGMTPLVASGMSQVKMFRSLAQRVATGSRADVRLVRFERGREMAIFHPEPATPENTFEKIGPELYREPGAEEPEEGPEVVEEGTVLGLGIGHDDQGVQLRIDMALGRALSFALNPESARHLAEEILRQAAAMDGRTATLVYARPIDGRMSATEEGA